MSAPQVLGLVGSVTIMCAMFEMLRRHMLREKYAAIWTLIAIGAFVVGIFPGSLFALSRMVGVAVPSNLLFFLAALVLLGLSLQQSYELGRGEERVRTLAEEVALLRLEVQSQRSAPFADPDHSQS